MTTKICIQCGIEKEAIRDNFYYQNKKENILENKCIKCRKKQDKKYNEKRLLLKKSEAYKKRTKSVQEKKFNNKTQKIEEETVIKESLNGLTTDLKAIDLYKKLTQDICILMRKNRIEKYGLNTQNLIIDLMVVSQQHLTKELNELKELIKKSEFIKSSIDELKINKKEVINIEWK